VWAYAAPWIQTIGTTMELFDSADVAGLVVVAAAVAEVVMALGDDD
jgi:hypothetical protein